MRTRHSTQPAERGHSVLLLLLAAAVVLFAAVHGSRAQIINQYGIAQISYEGENVGALDFVARPGINLDAFRPLVSQKAGEPFSIEKVRESIARLKQAGPFQDINVRVTPEANGLHVDFLLQPVYYIGTFQFPGALGKFDYSRLLQVVNYSLDEPYDERRIKRAEEALRTFFARNGYFEAGVIADNVVDYQHRLVSPVFHISLNQRAKFGHVEVKGAAPEEDTKLEAALHSFHARFKGAVIKAGKTYNPDRLRNAVSLLRGKLSGEHFLAAQVRLEPPRYDNDTNRAAVYFDVTPGPIVYVKTTGARVSQRTLHKLIPIFQENSYDEDLVEEGERNLVSYFQSKGFFDVKVNAQTEDVPQVITLVYQVDRGKRHKVAAVDIHGNEHFSDKELSPMVSVKKKRFLLSRGHFSDALVRKSVLALTNYYKSQGFEEVKVEPDVVDRDPNVFVTFKITEGPQTIVNALNLDGNKTQSVQSLAPKGLQLAPGKPYSLELLTKDRDRIVASYLNLGYPNVVFRSAVTPVKDPPHHVNVTYTIEEGPHTFISDVVNVGQQHTRPAFIDSIDRVDPDQPLSRGKLIESESLLYDQGIFDWVDVDAREPITNQSHEEVLVRMHESKRNTLTYGFGFEFVPRAANVPSGSVALPGLPVIGLPSKFRATQRQFASPRGSFEYTRRNLRGRAETASISVLMARLDQRGAFTYTDPHFRESLWSSTFTLSAERTSENPIFTARLGQASFELERPLDSRRTQRIITRYTIQRTSLTNLLIPELVLPQDRSVRLSTLSATYIRDTRDKPLDAHRGTWQTLNLDFNPKVIGSSANFARFLGQTAYYKQMLPWLVWANQARLGVAQPFAGSEVPLSERFFSGGASSLRGFPINGAGPQRPVPVCPSGGSSSDCVTITVPVGGNSLFILNSEARFPISIISNLGGVFFYDGGNVYQSTGFSHFLSQYSNTIGFGIRYNTPVGPVRFDVGRNLNPVSGLKATQFFVTLGQAF